MWAFLIQSVSNWATEITREVNRGVIKQDLFIPSNCSRNESITAILSKQKRLANEQLHFSVQHLRGMRISLARGSVQRQRFPSCAESFLLFTTIASTLFPSGHKYSKCLHGRYTLSRSNTIVYCARRATYGHSRGRELWEWRLRSTFWIPFTRKQTTKSDELLTHKQRIQRESADRVWIAEIKAHSFLA